MEFEHLVEFPLEEPFSISVSMSTTLSPTGSALITDEGSEPGWAKRLEARTGADITEDLYSFLDSNDKLNLMIASGDYTDILVGGCILLFTQARKIPFRLDLHGLAWPIGM